MFKKILLPLDGSEASEKAFETGMKLAKDLGASAIITHVIDQSMFENILTPIPGGPMEMAKPIYDDMKENAEDFLKKKAELCKQMDVKCESIIKMGHTVNSILDLAKETSADIIILGSRGRGRLAGATLGSVSYGVVHKAQNISVLVVR